MLTADQLIDLSEKRLTFTEFARQARGDFTALAAHIAKRWGVLPPAVQVDDLVQEMLLSVYRELPRYTGRTKLREHIVFRACRAARRELRRNAGSKSRDDTAHITTDVQEPCQEEVQLMSELLTLLPNDTRQRTIMHSLARTGSLDLTTAELLAHPDTRTMFATTDHKRAKHSLYRTVRKLAQRADAAMA